VITVLQLWVCVFNSPYLLEIHTEIFADEMMAEGGIEIT
jgi:hypothetical protein